MPAATWCHASATSPSPSRRTAHEPTGRSRGEYRSAQRAGCPMRTITIEGLRVLAMVGVLPHEFQGPQPVAITLSVDLPDAPTVPASDDMSQVLDYRDL